jgi:hypothetical protein
MAPDPQRSGDDTQPDHEDDGDGVPPESPAAGVVDEDRDDPPEPTEPG